MVLSIKTPRNVLAVLQQDRYKRPPSCGTGCFQGDPTTSLSLVPHLSLSLAPIFVSSVSILKALNCGRLERCLRNFLRKMDSTEKSIWKCHTSNTDSDSVLCIAEIRCKEYVEAEEWVWIVNWSKLRIYAHGTMRKIVKNNLNLRQCILAYLKTAS
jgi:hypothetical protein